MVSFTLLTQLYVISAKYLVTASAFSPNLSGWSRWPGSALETRSCPMGPPYQSTSQTVLQVRKLLTIILGSLFRLRPLVGRDLEVLLCVFQMLFQDL